MSRMKDWTPMIGDVNWEDYGAMWGRKLRDGVWFVLRFENMEEWGDGATGYHCDVLQVNLNELPETELFSALNCCGHEFDQVGNVVNNYSGEIVAERGSDTYELVLVECCVSYGCSAPMDSVQAKHRPLNVRAQARRIADELMRDEKAREARLNRPVNAIGSTAREFGAGDIQSAMNRHRSGGVRVKQIKQRSLSSECWLVQMWGTSKCASCEALGTDECGGQQIRATNKNENGVQVGPNGLVE